MKYSIVSAVLALASSTVFAGPVSSTQNTDEVVQYNCEPFRSSTGQILISAQAPQIITFKGDASPEKILYVKTAALTPSSVPQYTALTKVDQQIDNTSYKGENFSVSLFNMAGNRAHIEIGNGTYSNCIGVQK